MHRLSLQMVVFGMMLAGSAHTDAQSNSNIAIANRAVCPSGGVDANAADYGTLGYRDAGTGSVSDRFFVPSVSALLDSSFARTHCISLLADDATPPGETGIAFAPVAGDHSMLDVSGAIRISREPSLLRTIDVVYAGAGLPQSTGAWTGTVQYDTTAHGRVLATRWALHIPAVVRRVVTDGAASVAPAGNGGGDLVREAGGEIASATWSDGSRWDAGLPALRGQVVAASSHAPLSGVVVELRGTSFQSRTDSTGAFQFPPVVPGPYALDAIDGGLAEFGVTSAATAVIMVDRVHEPAPITFVMTSRSAMVDSLCADDRKANPGVPLGSALLVGQVTLPSGAPAAGAVVRASWADKSQGVAVPVRLGTRGDSTGAFQICGMPTNSPVRVTASLDSLVSVDSVVSARGGGDVRHVAVALTDLADGRLPSYRRRYPRVIGVDSKPISGVDVDDGLLGTVIGRSSADGRVGLGGLDEGRALLKLRKVGYEQRSLFVNIDPNDTTPVQVQLRTVSQLAAVKVTAQATLSVLAARSGFDERAKQGWGHFLGPAEMAKHRDVPLDVSLMSLGLRTRPLMFRGSTVGVQLLGGHQPPNGCPVKIYIDGFYSPGSIDASKLSTGDFAAAEYYADQSGAPDFTEGFDAPCGILVLWRRDQ